MHTNNDFSYQLGFINDRLVCNTTARTDIIVVVMSPGFRPIYSDQQTNLATSCTNAKHRSNGKKGFRSKIIKQMKHFLGLKKKLLYYTFF